MTDRLQKGPGSGSGSSRNHEEDKRFVPPGNPANRGFGLEHPAWRSDSVTMGTSPESTRIAMARQFARVIGDILGKETSSAEGAVDLLKRALPVPIAFASIDQSLLTATETVTISLGYDEATRNLASHLATTLSRATLLQKISAVAKLLGETVDRTFDAMLKGPTDLDTMMSYSGDGSMHTVFGGKGKVERMLITMVPGHLAGHFATTLGEAQEKYATKKSQLQGG